MKKIMNFQKLNLACGQKMENKFPFPWLNVDVSGPVADFHCDITKLPSEWDDSFSEVRASHVLEHFFLTDFNDVLRGWIRTLKPNGLIRVIVPNLETVIRELLSGFDFHERKTISLDETTATLAQIYGIGYDKEETPCQWRHRFIFSPSTLRELFERQGCLNDIELYDPTSDPAVEFGINDDSQNHYSICIKAKKTR